MRIEKKRNFSSISDLEERAFCEGYMYAQREFAKEADAVLAEQLNRLEYEREMEKRKKKRIGGHVMGALGTAGVINHVGGEVFNKVRGVDPIKELLAEDLPEGMKKGIKAGKWISRGLGLGATALTAGGLYRINKKANKNMTYEDWLAEKNAKNED